MSTPTPDQQGAAGLLGILGGTFDPIHHAHLALADAARAGCGLTALRWIPAGQPPHRQPPVASAADRLAMVRLAVAGRPGETVDSTEVDTASPSYTVPTLERLRRELGPAQPLALILGADAFLGLPSWHRWERLFELAHLIVTARPGSPLLDGAGDTLPAALQAHWQHRLADDPAALRQPPAGLIHPFAMPPVELSATAIRAELAAGRPVESLQALLPEAVIGYIRRHALYGSGSAAQFS